jgi:hypothetical protein
MNADGSDPVNFTNNLVNRLLNDDRGAYNPSTNHIFVSFAK